MPKKPFSLLPTLRYGDRPFIRKLIAVILAVFLPLGARAEIVIAAFGDSLTQGFGLEEADGFVPQMQNWLQERGHDVRLVNAGVSGDTMRGGSQRIGWVLSDSPDGIIVELGANDMLRGIDPEEVRESLKLILSTAKESGVAILLAGMISPLNYGYEYKDAFDAIYPELAAEFDVVFYPFFLEGLGVRASASGARGLMQSDGMHPSAEGVRAIVEHMGPTVEALIARIEGGE